MSVHTSKYAELFYKALEDLWVAEQSWFASPNIAVWSCVQAVEKTLKGFLRCAKMDFDHGHQLRFLLEDVETINNVTPETKKYILYLDDYGASLRYKNMASDPSPEESRIAIARVKHILREFNANHIVSVFMDESREVHKKVLESCFDKYSEVDISGDKPE